MNVNEVNLKAKIFVVKGKALVVVSEVAYMYM